MAKVAPHLSTGLEGLDNMLTGLIPGDNLVYQIDSVADYQCFVEAYWKKAVLQGFECIYFRFSDHEPLIDSNQPGVTTVALNPSDGCEMFISAIHREIDKAGSGAYLVFDCLSDLAEVWHSDQMLANFFRLTCPYILDVQSLAYFGILRHRHSPITTETIHDTCQVWQDVYRHADRLYVHPRKVQFRHSTRMHLLHVWEGEEFRPITNSAITSAILTNMPWQIKEHVGLPLGLWPRRLSKAERTLEAIQAGDMSESETGEIKDALLLMMISRDPRVLELARKYFSLADILQIGRRIVGTGLIGGKSVGMLLARAVLAKNAPEIAAKLELHDSFYIGSDVFYTFLVHNGLWWRRAKQRNPETFLEGAETARQQMLIGNFPQHIYNQFEDMLDYFGQSPTIVRSSSLLEDNFGNAFAGKYESVFCVNQDPRNRRLEDLIGAVQTIYASSMSHQALTYRAGRSLLELDEQMAILVQRVSGGLYARSLHFPHIAGVAFSYNPYVWSKEIDPTAGVLRLVFGLGTRAVDRTDDDYTRLVALNAPNRRPETDAGEIRQYSQQKADVLDLDANQLVSRSFQNVLREQRDLPLDLLVSHDADLEARSAALGLDNVSPYVLTFDGLFKNTDFVETMRKMLATIQEAYAYPVDVEFTTNFIDEKRYRVNIVQCRPLQVKGGEAVADLPEDLSREKMIFDAPGHVLGRSRVMEIDRILYIPPSAYCELPIADRYAVARLIGRVSQLREQGEPKKVLLLGPGRWGTTTPSLGIPVQFQDIHTISMMCEIVTMSKDLIPDVSLGTHFFSELVELDVLYFAMFPHRPETFFDTDKLEQAPNDLATLLPDSARWENTLRVIDPANLGDGKLLCSANVLDQRVVCYFEQ